MSSSRGAAGVGKTRLALAAMAGAERRQQPTHWVAATNSARMIPLGPFAGMWRDSGGDPLLVVREVMDVLLDGSVAGRVVVGVDDAHLLDEHSAFLVHHLVLQRSATLVLTIRSGYSGPDSITRLWKDGHLTRLELQPLAQEESRALIETALGGPVDDRSAHRMWSLTMGNALYLRHILEAEVAADRWRETGGAWHWLGYPRIPPGLGEPG